MEFAIPGEGAVGVHVSNVVGVAGEVREDRGWGGVAALQCSCPLRAPAARQLFALFRAPAALVKEPTIRVAARWIGA